MPQGQGNFYPEDLPVDWQLDYYCNAFQVVMVPESQWLEWTQDDLEMCLDAAQDDFGFYLRVDHDVTAQKVTKIAAVKKALGTLLKGVVVFSEGSVPSQKVALLPVSFVSKTLHMPGWQALMGDYKLSGHPVGYCDALSGDGRNQAGLVKAFMQQLPENNLGVAFFIDGDSINMEQVSNLKVVAEFLGY